VRLARPYASSISFGSAAQTRTSPATIAGSKARTIDQSSEAFPAPIAPAISHGHRSVRD
jgi:hypothetical protein